MTISDGVIQRSLETIWHPCSQMKDYEKFKPLHISGAEGCYLICSDGTKILDAISSWWCKLLGHNHPRLKQALLKQIDLFEHVILANTTNTTIVELSTKLTSYFDNLKKVFYASDGSCAIEIALKMSLHARKIRNQSHKDKIVSLQNAYHGETLFALSVSDVDIYRNMYRDIMIKSHYIQEVPYVSSCFDKDWNDCEINWIKIEGQLNNLKENLSTIIVEPILQAGAGMLVYSADFLRRLKNWCVVNDVYLIADEIMTGLGRTGKLFASHHANIEPDFLCLGKNMTAGWLPMSAVLLSEEIYSLFYDDYEKGNSFLHSHTFSGNVLAAAVALETLKIIESDAVYRQAEQLYPVLNTLMEEVKDSTKKIMNIRGIGGVVAADLEVSGKERVGFEVYQSAVKLGVLLRPLGNTIYWCPPLNITTNELTKLRDVTIAAIQEAYS